MLLTDLGLTPAEQLAFCRGRRDSFAQEFQISATVKKQLGERFRKERAALEPLLDPARDGKHPLSPGFEVFRRRSEQLAPRVAQLRELGLSKTVLEFAERYAHMHINRLLRAAQRAHELVLYDYLTRLLLSASER
jgi:thiopeptide-type bacteriocin biosynthesis protein